MRAIKHRRDMFAWDTAARDVVGLFFGLLLLFASGCVSSSAPSGWLSDPQDVAKTVRGAWIELGQSGRASTRTDRPVPGGQNIEGELIAVDEGSIHVLTTSGLQTVGIDEFKDARLFVYDAHVGELQLWSLAGTLSTASHGAFLILSLPVWLTVGIASSASRSRQPLIKYEMGRDDLNTIRPYARFPQGMPKGVKGNLKWKG